MHLAMNVGNVSASDAYRNSYCTELGSHATLVVSTADAGPSTAGPQQLSVATVDTIVPAVPRRPASPAKLVTITVAALRC
jgi:hypothetical protein